MMTTTNAYQTLKGAFLSKDTIDPFQTSELTKIQDFYGMRYEDMFDTVKMKKLWLKEDELKFVKENRDTMYSIKSTEGIEMREGLEMDKEWSRIKDFYGLSLDDIKTVEWMIKIGLKKDEIQFIKGDGIDLSPYYKEDGKWTKSGSNKSGWSKATKKSSGVSDTKGGVKGNTK